MECCSSQSCHAWVPFLQTDRSMCPFLQRDRTFCMLFGIALLLLLKCVALKQSSCFSLERECLRSHCCLAHIKLFWLKSWRKHSCSRELCLSDPVFNQGLAVPGALPRLNIDTPEQCSSKMSSCLLLVLEDPYAATNLLSSVAQKTHALKFLLPPLRFVPGDGNGQFHAMAAFLSTYSAASLRHAVVTWAFHNKPLWEDKCAVGADEWLRLMHQDKHWGDHVSLFCAAQLLARPLVIFKDLPGVPPLLVAPVDVPWGAPLFLLLDDVDPGAEHFSPLFPISCKRLRSKQPDLLGHLVDSEVHTPTTSSSRRRNALQERPPDRARLCRRRFDATLRKPASKAALRPPTTDKKALALVARGLAHRGLSQTAIQGLLNIAKDTARKLLHTA